jgi:hypothetical protein
MHTKLKQRGSEAGLFLLSYKSASSINSSRRTLGLVSKLK